MNNLKYLLNLNELGEYLSGPYADAFSEFFGFISFISIIMFVVYSMQKVPPFSKFVKSFREEISSTFSETPLMHELIPNEESRLRLYRFFMWCFFLFSVVCFIMSLFYAITAITTLIAENIKANRYIAFVALSFLFLLAIFLSKIFMKEANNIAKFLNKKRA